LRAFQSLCLRGLVPASVLVIALASGCGDDSGDDTTTTTSSTTGETGDADTGPDDTGGDGDDCAALSHDGAVPLAATVAATSQVAEYNLTESFAAIEKGDGTPGDGDGLFNVNDPDQRFGSPVDVFPREGAFVVGELSFDAGQLTGCDTESTAITALDLGELWAAGEDDADISASALALWLFEAPYSLAFGALDESDTVTFTDGVLTSIDLEVTFTFTVDFTFGAGSATSYVGTLAVQGATLALSIDDTQTDVETAQGTVPESRVVFDITGSLSEVTASLGSGAR